MEIIFLMKRFLTNPKEKKKKKFHYLIKRVINIEHKRVVLSFERYERKIFFVEKFVRKIFISKSIGFYLGRNGRKGVELFKV